MTNREVCKLICVALIAATLFSVSSAEIVKAQPVSIFDKNVFNLQDFLIIKPLGDGKFSCLKENKYQVTLPGLDASIQNGQINFRGCNFNFHSFSKSGDSITVSGGGSTLIYCQIDNDSIYSQRLVQANKIKIITQNNQNKIQFWWGEESFGQYYEELVLIFVSKLHNHPIDEETLEGEYYLYLPPLQLEFTQDSIKFQGCNYVRGDYKVQDDGEIKIFEDYTTTYRYCQNDYDQLVSQALKGSTFIDFIDDKLCSFRLFSKEKVEPNLVGIPIDEEGTVLLQRAYPGSQLQLEGQFELKLVGSDLDPIKVSIKDQSFSFEECNIHNFKYVITQHGRNYIAFSQFSSTFRACFVDYDHEFLDAFQSTSYYTYDISSGVISFFDNTGKVLLTNKVNSNDRWKVVEIGNEQIKEQVIFSFEVGSTSINFSGCNFVGATVTYNSASKTQDFEIDNFISTLIFCPNSIDGQVIDALQKSTSLKQSTDQLVFYDENDKKTLTLSSL